MEPTDYSGDNSFLKSILVSATPRLRTCFEDYLQGNPKTPISFSTQVIVDNSGQVESVTLSRTFPNKLDNCFKYSFYQLKFPPNTSPGAKGFEINQPYKLFPVPR